MFISKAAELRRKNDEIHTHMCKLVTDADADNHRAMTADEQTRWDALDNEFRLREVEITQHETLEARNPDPALDTRQAGREPTPASGDPAAVGGEARVRNQRVNRAFRNFVCQNPGEWDAETRETIQERRTELPPEIRALGLTGSAGGFTVPDDFMAELEKALLSFSGVAQAARGITTATGASMPWPTVNDSGNAGALLAEGSAAPDTTDPVFAAVTFDAFVYTSKILRIANQLLQDTAFPLESELALMLGERLGRILNLHGTTGDGSAKPRGIVTAVLADTTPIGAAGATAITYADLVDLQHGVDPSYRQRNPAFMMHDDILKAIKKLVDGNARPLWAASMAVREPSTILGHPFFINQDMDAVMAAAAESVLFGDFSKYIIRRVLNPILVVLRERYAEFFQTGIVMFARWDSDLVDAGTGPIKVLQH